MARHKRIGGRDFLVTYNTPTGDVKNWSVKTACGREVPWNNTCESPQWRRVTCKNCLKNKPKIKPKSKSSKSKFAKKELWIITCMAQYISEGINTDTSLLDLPNFIEDAAELYCMAKFGMNSYRAKTAVKEIKSIWAKNDGYWPDEYRF